MKKLLIGLIALVSTLASATDLPKQCNYGPRSESYIQNKDGKSPNGDQYKADIVYVFDNSARDLYSQIDVPEKEEILGDTKFFGKTKGQIHCLRQDLQESELAEICANYQCAIWIMQK